MADAPQNTFTPEQMQIVQQLIAQANPPAPFNPYPAALGTAPIGDASAPAWQGAQPSGDSSGDPLAWARNSTEINQPRLNPLNPNGQAKPAQQKQVHPLPNAQELMVQALLKNPTADFAQAPERILQNPVSSYANDVTNILKPDVVQAAKKITQMLSGQPRIAGMAPGSQQQLPPVI